jgi:L-threonylcarbamoyladenylate synthase
MQVVPASELTKAVAAIEAGQLVIVPTSRWYMICANALDGRACQSIFDAKRRPTSKAMLLVVPRLDAATTLFDLPSAAVRLADAFWPGDLAMTLRWRDPTTGGRFWPVGDQQALVTCAPGILGDLVARARVPVAATSVNVSGETATDGSSPAITVSEVEQFVRTSGVEVALCIDGGTCPAANHLTVVDSTSDEVRLTRPGLVHARAVSAVLGEV